MTNPKRFGITFPLILWVAIGTAQAQTYKVLHNFGGGPADGAEPAAALIRDAAGNLYGTTVYGGSAQPSGYGTVFKLDKHGVETVLYNFTGGADGAYPSGLVMDSAGNLYGTTEGGGTGFRNSGYGVVFKVDATGTEAVLHTFTGGSDGGYPFAGMILDSSGNLYGTTGGGGIAAGADGYGVVFKMDGTGNETVLYTFTGGTDGAKPTASLVRDSSGNLYSTTQYGGIAVGISGYGVAFKLDAAGTETPLYAFSGGTDGANPTGLTLDSASNLYGTTYAGGTVNADAGVVFKLDTFGTFTVLYTFTGGTDGGEPAAGVILDSVGNLYGTTVHGGLTRNGLCFSGCGVIFKVDTTGAETVLHSFTGNRRVSGDYPSGGLIRDLAGNLYGTAESGGTHHNGVVFALKP